ncbi:MAG: hypothetical protein QOE90_1739 [Thermoplasmata archaeon]|jgi:hypothetical protein|nr:hypothetical protein [Thermoplasmata archaeon]
MRVQGFPSAGRNEIAHAVVEESLSLLRFPIEKEVAIARIGDRPLPVDGSLTLGDILRGVPAKAFADPFHAARAADARIDTITKALEAVAQAERRNP